jgi:hypothetical protein
MSAQLKDLTRSKPAGQVRSGLVKISHGVHNLEAAIAGKPVGEVRQALKEPLNIDPRALALVNGRDVAASHVLKSGDQLEFVRLAGEKGGVRWPLTKTPKKGKYKIDVGRCRWAGWTLRPNVTETVYGSGYY